LETDLKYGAGKLKANFNWDSTTKKNKILAVYRQIYYSIDVDTPMSGADFIAPSMTVPQLKAALPPGSRPMYIAGVSYGMMALMFIETDSSEENMKAALDAEYKGGAEVKINGEMTAKDILEDSSIQTIVYGGSTAGLRDLETGYAGFKKVIEASSNFGPDSPGVPLLYKFRHLTDNTIAQIPLTSQYTITTPVQIVQDVKVTLASITCTRLNDDDGPPLDIDQIQVGLNAYNKKLPAKEPQEELIELQPMNVIYGEVPLTQIYYKGTLNQIFWKAFERGNTWNAGQPSIYISFRTDPDLYDYEAAKIEFLGYAHDHDSFPTPMDDNDSAYGDLTVSFRDFLANEGKHTLVITGTDFDLEVVVKIELVE
jgi:hypothetical protein